MQELEQREARVQDSARKLLAISGKVLDAAEKQHRAAPHPGLRKVWCEMKIECLRGSVI